MSSCYKHLPAFRSTPPNVRMALLHAANYHCTRCLTKQSTIRDLLDRKDLHHHLSTYITYMMYKHSMHRNTRRPAFTTSSHTHVTLAGIWGYSPAHAHAHEHAHAYVHAHANKASHPSHPCWSMQPCTSMHVCTGMQPCMSIHPCGHTFMYGHASMHEHELLLKMHKLLLEMLRAKRHARHVFLP